MDIVKNKHSTFELQVHSEEASKVADTDSFLYSQIKFLINNSVLSLSTSTPPSPLLGGS